jgi:hypothetical protein
LLYTGNFDGIHRENHETNIRHEVILFWWLVLKNTGSRTEPFGRMIQEYTDWEAVARWRRS